MNKVFKLFKAFFLLLKQPSLLNNVLNDADVNKNEVKKKYNLPKGLKTIELTDLIPNLNITVNPYCSMDGGSTPVDLALLIGLATQKPNCNYFEIGTWRGESVANVATVAEKCITLNISDKEMQALGLEKSYIDLHRFFSKNLNNVIHIQANSLTFDYSTLNQKFDLIFIDGDHHYESVKSDTKNAFQLLKDENSIIVWHDYGHTPADIRWDVFRGILDGSTKEQIQYLYRVSNTLCAIYTQQKIASIYPTPNANPKKQFSIHIKANQ